MYPSRLALSNLPNNAYFSGVAPQGYPILTLTLDEDAKLSDEFKATITICVLGFLMSLKALLLS